MVDPTAKFERQVLTPGGSLYAPTCDMGHWVAKAKETGYPKQYGTFLRSDFSLDFYGGDPKVFHGQYVTIKFRVSKGNIQFPSPGEVMDRDYNIHHKKDCSESQL